VVLTAVTRRAGRRIGRILAEAEEAGREDVAVYSGDPQLLPRLELGAFEERPAAEATGLRLALRLPVPPGALARAGRIDDERLAFLRAYAFWYGVRRAIRDRDLWRRLTRGVTVLMYHGFGSPGEPRSRFVLPAAEFERQLRWLRRLRPVIDLRELAACRREHRLPPADAVAITIDDGYADVRAVAPSLRRHAIPATVFVVTGRAGGVNDWDRGELAGRPLLSWRDVEGLAREGVSIGAHTRTHPQLPLLARNGAREEVEGSRADLERRLGAPPETFAYPHGRVDEATASVIGEAGFSLACGSRRGRNGAATAPLELRRVEIDGRLSLARFVRMLAPSR
jgi:peptidoglycan/xylan/chitin deacetylase (PgdA/CDA1 family)